MDIEEFEKRMKPSAKRSRLEPFRAQILELKAKGYANWQVCEWLAANEVKVSQEAVRKFIAKGDKGARVHASPATDAPAAAAQVQPPQPPAAAPQVTPKGEGPPEQGPEEDLSMLSPKERRERKAQRFVKDSSNSVLKTIIKEKK